MDHFGSVRHFHFVFRHIHCNTKLQQFYLLFKRAMVTAKGDGEQPEDDCTVEEKAAMADLSDFMGGKNFDKMLDESGITKRRQTDVLLSFIDQKIHVFENRLHSFIYDIPPVCALFVFACCATNAAHSSRTVAIASRLWGLQRKLPVGLLMTMSGRANSIAFCMNDFFLRHLPASYFHNSLDPKPKDVGALRMRLLNETHGRRLIRRMHMAHSEVRSWINECEAVQRCAATTDDSEKEDDIIYEERIVALCAQLANDIVRRGVHLWRTLIGVVDTYVIAHSVCNKTLDKDFLRAVRVSVCALRSMRSALHNLSIWVYWPLVPLCAMVHFRTALADCNAGSSAKRTAVDLAFSLSNKPLAPLVCAAAMAGVPVCEHVVILTEWDDGNADWRRQCPNVNTRDIFARIVNGATAEEVENAVACLHNGECEGVVRAVLEDACETLTSEVEADLRKENGHDTAKYCGLLELPPMRVGARLTVHVKSTVEALLSERLYDADNNEELKARAKARYGLEILCARFPLEQDGLDAIEILRTIDTFVKKYKYNMHHQLFVEIQEGSDDMRVVGLTHITNSVQSHGLGIVNTSVNATYQFLKSKMQTVSQFLCDDVIKSRLLADRRWFCDFRKSSSAAFPFERALETMRIVKSVGVAGDGQNFLDKFRELLTHIGNAIGYIRTLKAASLRLGAGLPVGLPLSPLVPDEAVEVKKTAEQVDQVAWGAFYKENIDFVSILVELFSRVMQGVGFYLIIPALVLCFLEAIVSAKEKITMKRPTTGGYVFDDGFALGVAFVLSILNQRRDYEALHFFDGLAGRFDDAPEKSKAQKFGARLFGDDVCLRKNRQHELEAEHLAKCIDAAFGYINHSSS
eukprot:GEMP01001677.1.p1 GENE.GEMP01001677.1~~GEMP01001677.1.p1  ORF type:complete len:860 (+),score=189.69 GEMP01001677.1:751-3330(+)